MSGIYIDRTYRSYMTYKSYERSSGRGFYFPLPALTGSMWNYFFYAIDLTSLVGFHMKLGNLHKLGKVFADENWHS